MDYESEDLENLMEYDTEVEKDFVADERELPSRYVSWQEVENEMYVVSCFYWFSVLCIVCIVHSVYYVLYGIVCIISITGTLFALGNSSMKVVMY